MTPELGRPCLLDSYDLASFTTKVLEPLRRGGSREEGMFLDVPFSISVRRMAERDGTHPDPEHPSMRRYVEGQRIHVSRCHPAERATHVVQNS